MTTPDMNASRLSKMSVGLSVVGLAGCAAAFDPAIDPTSPQAATLAAIVAENRTYPRWEDFPAAPTDLPTPVQIARSVNTMRIDGASLTGEVARLEWRIEDADSFASDLSSRVSPPPPAVVGTPEDIEAFAERLRRRVTPPPPVVRPPRP